MDSLIDFPTMEPCDCFPPCQKTGRDTLTTVLRHTCLVMKDFQHYKDHKKRIKYLTPKLKDNYTDARFKISQVRVLESRWLGEALKVVLHETLSSVNNCKTIQFYLNDNPDQKFQEFLDWKKKNSTIINKLLSLERKSIEAQRDSNFDKLSKCRSEIWIFKNYSRLKI